MKSERVYIGTSGWIYKDWAKNFYPKDWPARRNLEYYVSQFPTVEINASFYRLPTEKAFQDWTRNATPQFLFALKGSRAVTHYKRLLPGAKSFHILLERSKILGTHLGPILWQLPGSFRKDLSRLEQFLAILPRENLHAMEFRHASWMDDKTLALLSEYQVANVSLSSQSMPMCTELTAPFAYVRFHGLENGAAHDYTREELEPWANFLQRIAREGSKAFVYFNNDVNTRAPLNALTLMQEVGEFAVRATALNKTYNP